MSLRILFADDSMTAQNMGKKILSEAGYEVVAVSNGAAAVKKIAEHKPDIIILDVYMPGYSGLEVCEKVRASLDTVKTPVLLTVGKMEPYKPEDANRVKADGVIIKPFEASDLLAIIKKFEERIGQTPVPPMVEQTVRLEKEYQENAIAEAQMQNHATGKTGIQPMVEVPDHMAGSSAFTDMLSADAPMTTQHFAVNTPAAAFETSVIVPAPPIPSTEYGVPVSWRADETPEPEVAASTAAKATQEEEIVVTPVEASSVPDTVPIPVESLPEPEFAAMIAEPEKEAVQEDAIHVEPAHPQFIPVYKEPEPQPEPASYEMIPTASPALTDLEIPREPALQERAEDTTRATVADHVEPGLMSTIDQQMEVHQAAERQQPEPSFSAATESDAAAKTANSFSADSLPAPNAVPEVSDADFEARVAAAMAAYTHAAEPTSTLEPAAGGHASESAEPSTSVYTAQAVVTKEREAEAAPSFEYHPPVRVAEIVSAEPVAESYPAPMQAAAETASAPSMPEAEPMHHVISAGVEAAAAVAASETGADHESIALAVSRVMERLKPELVEEIMRELRPRK